MQRLFRAVIVGAVIGVTGSLLGPTRLLPNSLASVGQGRPQNAQTTPPLQQSNRDYIRVSNVQAMRLTHRTTVFLDKPADKLYVYHAIPVEPLWYDKAGPLYLSGFQLTLKEASPEITPQRDGYWWVWKPKSLGQGEYNFESRYDVVSADRELMTEKLSLTWEDIATAGNTIPTGEATVEEANAPLPAEVVQMAQAVKASTADPLDAVRQFCRWINTNITYDTTVSYSPSDLASILKHRKGWCGHRAMALDGLCRAVGIPLRRVTGFKLGTKPGLWNGKDDWNRHTWAEIYLPKVGWVEVEPAASQNPFRISSRYIKNPRRLQSAAIRVYQGKEKMPEPDYRDTITAESVPVPKS